MTTHWPDEDKRQAALDLLALVTAFDDDEDLAARLIESQSDQANMEQLFAALPLIVRFVRSTCDKTDASVKDWVATASDMVRTHL